MTHPLRSMTGRLIFGFFSGTVAVLLITGLITYREVGTMVTSSVDRVLHSKRQILTGLIHEEHGGVEFELSEIIAGEYVIPRSGHYYRVTSSTGILAASPSLVDSDFLFAGAPPPGAAAQDEEILYTSTGPDNEPVRVLRYQYTAFSQTFDIILAESISDGLAMMETFKRFLLAVVPLSIVALCFMAWSIARISLRPLTTFSSAIEAISHRNLTDHIGDGKTVQELSVLARSFNALLDRLHKVFESEKRLVADASHELKTPLSVIKTQCDVVLQHARSPEEYIEALRSVQSSARSMSRLITDLLSLARLDAGLLSNADFTECSLIDCINRAADMTRSSAAERGIRVTSHINADLAIAGSCDGLVEAFMNIMENAVKYNRDGGSIDVAAETNNGFVSVTIADTGIGIKDSDRARIFERFYRADTARTFEGTGLGLSIVKAVVEAHGGRILVKSEPGVGSRFIVELPGLSAH